MSKQFAYFKTHDDTLEMYTKALVRAHGEKQPEVYKIREIYQEIQKKMFENQDDFEEQLEALKFVTRNFEIPQDVCQTYEKTYLMLKEVYDLKKEE